jgi:hypothetical protein
MKTNSLLKLHAEYIKAELARDAAYARTCEPLEYPDGYHSYDGCSVCNEHSARHAAFIAASDAFKAAKNEFVDALFATDHGAQSDGSFVGISYCFPFTGQERRYLHAPARQGVIAVGLSRDWTDWDRSSGYIRGTSTYLEFVCTRDEARAKRETERAERRAEQVAYEADRQLAGDALASGRGLPWRSGQEGGAVGIDGRLVSAPGALRACRADGIVGELYVLMAAIEDRYVESGASRYDCYALEWILFRDGLAAIAPNGTVYAFGDAANAWFGVDQFAPHQRRTRARSGKRRKGKTFARRSERRNGRLECEVMS